MAEQLGTIIKLGMNSTDMEQSASSVNRQIKILDSGFKAVSADAKAFGETQSTLTEKQRILTQKVSFQSARVKDLNREYEKSKRESGENSVATQRLAVRVNNATTSLTRMRGQLNNVNTSLDNQRKKFKLNSEQMKSFGKDAAKNLAKVGVAMTAMAVGALKITTDLGNMADRMLDLNSITGMSTQALQEWQHASVVAGTSLEAMSDASLKFTQSMSSMDTESSKSRKALSKLGISFVKISKMDADQRMNTLVEALQGVSDKTKRAEIGTTLFGKKFSDLAPILDLGIQGLKDARANAHVFSDEELNKANNFRIAMDEMKTELGFVTQELAMGLLPQLQEFAEKIKENMPQIKKTVFATVSILVKVFKAFGKAISFVVENLDVLLPILMAIGSVLLVNKIAHFAIGVSEAFVAVGISSGVMGAGLTAVLPEVLLITAGIAALALAIYAISKAFKSGKTEAKGFKQEIKDATNINTTSYKNNGGGQFHGYNSFAVGTNRLNKDQRADVHEDEAILPAKNNPFNPNATDLDWIKGKGSNGDIYIDNITIDAKNVKDFNDVVDVIKNLKQTKRQLKPA